MVRWLADHRIVLGLANVQGQLGFNNSGLLYAATFESLGHNVAHHLALGLPTLVLCGSAIVAFGRYWRHRGASVLDAYMMIVGFVALYAVLAPSGIHLRDLSTDAQTDIVLVVAGGFLGSCLLRHRTRRGLIADAWAGTLLMSLAATVKLSAAVPGLAMWLTVATVLAMRLGARHVPWAKLVAGSALLVGPWLVRGLLLSGYPFYPKSYLGLPVRWRVPVAHADAEAVSIGEYARWNAATPPDAAPLAWVPGWLKFLLTQAHPNWLLVPLALTVAALVVLMLVRRRGHTISRLAVRAGWLWWAAPSLIGLIVWALAAPAPRFATGMAWMLAAICVACLLSTGGAVIGRPRLWRKAVTGLCVTYVLALLALTVWYDGFILPRSHQPWGLEPPRNVPTRVVRIDDDVCVLVVADDSKQPWASTPPTVNELDPRLRAWRINAWYMCFYREP